MSSYYIRHELLRHLAVRKHSMLYVEHEKKFIYASYGFYATKKSFICFSCNYSVPLNFSGNIHEKHVSDSSQCSFLDGRDVSIEDITSTSNEGLQICGHSLFNNKDFYYRKLVEEQESLLTTSKVPIGSFILNCVKWRPSVVLKPFNSPIFVPAIDDNSKFLHIEIFFLLMRNEERRLKTFQITYYPFVGGEVLAKNLAKNGFIYTLLNTTIQCAFCRICLTNISEPIDIKSEHIKLSPQCKFAKGLECFNIPREIKQITDSPTENIDIQCKVCLTNCVKIVFNCGHVASCYSCATQLNQCPICRQYILTKKQIFLC